MRPPTEGIPARTAAGERMAGVFVSDLRLVTKIWIIKNQKASIPPAAPPSPIHPHFSWGRRIPAMSTSSSIVVFICLCITVGLVSLLAETNLRVHELTEQLAQAGDTSATKHYTTGSHSINIQSGSRLDTHRDRLYAPGHARGDTLHASESRGPFFDVVGNHIAHDATPAEVSFLHKVAKLAREDWLGLPIVEKVTTQPISVLSERYS